MSQITQYHITFETPTHFGEADVEVGYVFERNPLDEDEAYYQGQDDGYAPHGKFQFFDIIITDKATGLSEEVDEMPDDLLNVAKEAADENFDASL